MDKLSITMTKTASGSEDGIRIKRYKAGHTYVVGADLAQAFIRNELARATDQTDKKDQHSKKAAKGPNDNK